MSVPGVALGDWRAGNAAKREVVRRNVMLAVTEGRPINGLIERLKRDSDYERLPENDRNGFNVMASQMRAIVERWRYVDPAMQRGFADGSIPFSRVYGSLKGF